MTAQSKKPTQKRLHNCVLSQPKWAQNLQNAPTKRPRTPKGSYFKANTIARVENAPENAQARCNTKLLGKYPIKLRKPCAPHSKRNATKPIWPSLTFKFLWYPPSPFTMRAGSYFEQAIRI